MEDVITIKDFLSFYEHSETKDIAAWIREEQKQLIYQMKNDQSAKEYNEKMHLSSIHAENVVNNIPDVLCNIILQYIPQDLYSHLKFNFLDKYPQLHFEDCCKLDEYNQFIINCASKSNIKDYTERIDWDNPLYKIDFSTSGTGMYVNTNVNRHITLPYFYHVDFVGLQETNGNRRLFYRINN